MAYKSQDTCYRMIKGERYVNVCDVHGDFEQAIVDQVKAKGFPHRLIKHPDGFRSLFVRAEQAKQIEI